MNYFKIKIFQGEDDKKEIIVNEDTRNRIEEALDNHATRINLGDRGSYHSSQIMGIENCNSEVAEYQKEGLEIPGLLEGASILKITGEVQGPRKIGDYLKETHNSFFEKMGWKK